MKKTKMEFSKKILLCTAAVMLGVIIFACAASWRHGDLSPLTQIIVGGFALLSVAVGFYYWKARAENIIKIQQKYGTEAASLAKDAANGGETQ